MGEGLTAPSEAVVLLGEVRTYPRTSTCGEADGSAWDFLIIPAGSAYTKYRSCSEIGLDSFPDTSVILSVGRQGIQDKHPEGQFDKQSSFGRRCVSGAMIAPPQSNSGDSVVLRSKTSRAALWSFFILGCVLSMAGCSGGSWSPPKKYSGGGPLPEESEVLERLKSMPKTGRYAEQPPSPKSSKRVQKARKSR
jgi:hypothetical protein